MLQSLSTSHLAVNQIGRRAGPPLGLAVRTRFSTPGTPAPHWWNCQIDRWARTRVRGARKGDERLIAVTCCLVCLCSSRLMGRFRKMMKNSDDKNPWSRDLPLCCL